MGELLAHWGPQYPTCWDCTRSTCCIFNLGPGRQQTGFLETGLEPVRLFGQLTSHGRSVLPSGMDEQSRRDWGAECQSWSEAVYGTCKAPIAIVSAHLWVVKMFSLTGRAVTRSHLCRWETEQLTDLSKITEEVWGGSAGT